MAEMAERVAAKAATAAESGDMPANMIGAEDDMQDGVADKGGAHTWPTNSNFASRQKRDKKHTPGELCKEDSQESPEEYEYRQRTTPIIPTVLDVGNDDLGNNTASASLRFGGDERQLGFSSPPTHLDEGTSRTLPPTPSSAVRKGKRKRFSTMLSRDQQCDEGKGGEGKGWQKDVEDKTQDDDDMPSERPSVPSPAPRPPLRPQQPQHKEHPLAQTEGTEPGVRRSRRIRQANRRIYNDIYDYTGESVLFVGPTTVLGMQQQQQVQPLQQQVQQQQVQQQQQAAAAHAHRPVQGLNGGWKSEELDINDRHKNIGMETKRIFPAQLMQRQKQQLVPVQPQTPLQPPPQQPDAGGESSSSSTSAQKKKVIKQQQQRLVLLRHASKCTAGPSCSTKFCPQMVTLWKHIRHCRDKGCGTPHCLSSRCVLNHYRKCKEENRTASCEVCAPVMKHIQTQNANSSGSGQESKKQGPSVDAGREIMRVAVETPNFEPVQIPLEYIKESTEDFLDERKLGEGSFSRVFEGKDRIIRRKFAVKQMKLMFHSEISLAEARRTFEKEIATLKHFRHPNIARLYAYCLDPDLHGTHCLVYELASLGSLNDFLRNSEQKGRRDWTKRISIALDVSRALEYMHGGNGGQICFHRDVKSPNICLKRDYTALLIDCGIAKMIPQDDSKATMTVMESAGNGLRGTPGYICPTFGRLQKNYGSANEVFSLGVVLVELFTGLLQNEEVDGEMTDLFDRYSEDGSKKVDLVSAADESAGQWDANAKKSFADLALRCIAQRPENRPRISEIVECLSNLASQARPWSVGERNRVTVLTSAPLVYSDEFGTHPITMLPDVSQERESLTRCIEESNRDIGLIFDVATDDRLQAAATKRCACLHFCGHGHPEALLFEDNSGGALWLGEDKLIDCVHDEPFTFVFVSACHSSFMGDALIKAGVRHVVCCKHDAVLRDDVALKFTYIFYLALAEGYTLHAAFQKGKGAVSTRFDEDEVNKFVLLPEHGVDHNVPIFSNADVLEWKDEIKVLDFIPPSPCHVEGREKEEWELLDVILKNQLVNFFGNIESERSSMAKAVCQFINERRTVLRSIEVIYYLQDSDLLESSGEMDGYDQLVQQLHGHLNSEGRVGELVDGSDMHSITASIVCALQEQKALVVFEVQAMNSHLMNFLSSVLSKTIAKVLVVSPNEIDFAAAGVKVPSVPYTCG